MKITHYQSDHSISQPISENHFAEFKNQLYYQNKKNARFRQLTNNEIILLVKNNNYSDDWSNILVTDKFDPSLVINCEFYGHVTIDDLEKVLLEHNQLKMPVGINNSTIISCNIGKRCVIRNVRYLSYYTISDNCILFNIDEMTTTDNAKFGNGILKDGEPEHYRIWIEIANEIGGRAILPFDNMIPADAYLWSKFRDDLELQASLKMITENQYDTKRGYYGLVGESSVIKHTRIIKNVKIGSHAYIKGANKLKNVTIHSNEREYAQIGEGVELVNGIMGYGCNVFYNAIAVRFILGRNCQLKYGARLINSVLGDNSTVSCCELLNNLIFPFHEQHHNSSFLISATLLGQSNIAAGATIGSNHNSRASDGEIVAGRGFWPGLCTDFKHSCRFASYVLVAKGSYKYEMNIKYPFSLVSVQNDQLTIMPAYWLLYNMYAMARNDKKYQNRDKRKVKIQNIETDFLAPDAICDVLEAIDLINYNLGKIVLNDEGAAKGKCIEQAKLHYAESDEANITYCDHDAVKRGKALIVKPLTALNVYRKLCIFFFVKQFIKYDFDDFKIFKKHVLSIYKHELYLEWTNLGGQLIPKEKLNKLKNEIKNNKLANWDEIHKRYDDLYKEYAEDKARYALYALERSTGKELRNLSDEDLKKILEHAKDIASEIYEKAYSSRAKDYSDPFRSMMYENAEEMKQVLGDINENDFLNSLKEDTDQFKAKIDCLL
jgi:NDP-sugar pyrophosphorylase family protein